MFPFGNNILEKDHGKVKYNIVDSHNKNQRESYLTIY
jgi:hypothetical protein